MATRQTLRDFLTSIGKTTDSISMPIDPGPDGIVNEGDDLGVDPGTEQALVNLSTGDSLLGDYASFTSRRNLYPLSPGAHEAPSSTRGSAIQQAQESSAPSVFADPSVSENGISLNRSNSTTFDAAGYTIDSIVDKTGDGSAQNGNELLPGVIPATSNSDAEIDQSRAVIGSFASLKKYNNFSPTSSPSSYADDDAGITITSGDYESSRSMRVQVGAGAYEPQTVELSADVSQEELQRVARSMILKAAGWDTSDFPNQAANPDTAFEGVTSGDMSKFPTISARKQGTPDHFRAQDAYGMPLASNGEDSLLSGRGDVIQKESDEAVYTRTRGSTHTTDQRFGDFDLNLESNERVQSLQAGIAMLGLANIIDRKVVSVSREIAELQVKNDSVLRGPYYPGTSIRSNVSAKTRALIDSFMFQTGIYSYTACVSEGLYSCFGLSGDFSALQAGIPFETPDLAIKYSTEIEKIAGDLAENYPSKYDSPMFMSQGFWRSVSESAYRSIVKMQQSAERVNGADFVEAILGMKDSLAVKIMNVFCSIGYQRLIIQGVSSEAVANGERVKNPYDVDSYPNAPGTRQMKSRDGQLLSNSSLAWRNSVLPSMFILPVEAMAATLDLDYMFDPDKGANPIKGMLGSTMYDKTYVKGTRNSNNIPPVAARLLEDRLGAEYVPFYFRDLRTNEIIAFHAFLESVTDGFTANYTETRGFGRADPVQNYSSTNRSINLTFWIAATSKEDFDEMWFKINKLTTMLYPQYTRGRSVTQKDESASVAAIINQNVNFEQPFSQLAGGTPVIRLRIGDLIKTNYSRSSFAKLFGVGNDTFFVTPNTTGAAVASALTAGLAGGTGAGSFGGDAGSFGTLTENIDIRLLPFLAYAGSPMEATQLTSLFQTQVGSGIAGAVADAAAEAGAYFLKNGFVNPFLYADRSRFFTNNIEGSGGDRAQNLGEDSAEALDTLNLRSGLILKARGTPYKTSSQNIRLQRPVLVKYVRSVKSNDQNRTGPAYQVEIDDPTVGADINGTRITVSAADLYVDSGQIVNIAATPGILLGLGAVAGLSGFVFNLGSGAAATGLAAAGLDAPIDVPLADFFGSVARTFTSPYNNPIAKAFEDRMGEGLAGVAKSMSFNWMEAPWETDWNSRAPMACKVTLGFAPIHDIAPGLDSNGFNRAPIYNVGQIMHDTFGQPRSDGGNASRYFYKKGGAIAENASNPEAVDLPTFQQTVRK